MADQQIVPDTINVHVARMAIAWDIVSRVAAKHNSPSGDKFSDTANTLTQNYIEVYNAILANEKEQGTI